ncbi:protease FtsH-inhibitory lysogeny factor CIII [Erwinia sp. QL-Z3]|jgi:hypothetical protein|nr:protease FtsH-inhibitory lysogeny factor CIII [Erwinia sp. QL-Z3]QBR52758.1 protease FtsH-inhibitory lysogeny factor CIII [Erwinia sp. QL-Z3]
MNYAIEGGAIVGSAQFYPSQLSRLTERLRKSFRSLIDILNQPGRP